MQCPVCSQSLSTVEAAPGLMVDWCESGCRGIWFDAFELKQLDEKHEHPDSPVLQADAVPAPSAGVSRKAKLHCPRCETVKLMRHHFSVKRQVLVDSCPQCGGHWLDAGELQQIRQQYHTAEAREEAALREIEEHLELLNRHRENREPRRPSRVLPLVEWIVETVEDL